MLVVTSATNILEESDEECDQDSVGGDAQERYDESGEAGNEDDWEWRENINMD